MSGLVVLILRNFKNVVIIMSNMFNKFIMKFLIQLLEQNDKCDKSIGNGLKQKCLKENEKVFIDVSLTEYKELRGELREVIARQNSVLLSSIAQFATLVGIGVAIISSEKALDLKMWIGNLFCVVIPCITLLLGIIWIDLAYRQIRTAAYIYKMENQINKLIHVDCCQAEDRKALFWEHYVDKKLGENGNKRFEIISYACSVTTYLILPLLLFVVGLNLYGWQHTYLISLIVFVLSVWFIFKYIIGILREYMGKDRN